MIQGILDGICLAIDGEFNQEGKAYEIYTEAAEQELAEPCFSVLCINASHAQQVGIRYLKSYQFSILYFPAGKDVRAECHEAAERLCSCLELIGAGDGKVRGGNMASRLEDGVLVFTVDFDVFVCKAGEKEEMARISKETRVEG